MTKKNKILLGWLGATLVASYSGAVSAYIYADHHTVGDALWWAFVTFSTVGYGDEYPNSAIGRLSGSLLVAIAIFVVVPVITAIISSTLIHDEHEWTHDEQEEVKAALRELLRRTEK